MKIWRMFRICTYAGVQPGEALKRFFLGARWTRLVPESDQLWRKGVKRFACLCLIVLSVASQLVFPLDGWAQNIQTPYDTIPNFAQNPTIQSAQAGNWSSASTWSPARVPIASDIVLVRHTVTYDSTTGDADSIGIDTGGTLRFSTTQNTTLRVANLLVMPNGALEVGTQSSPLPSNLRAEIIVKSKALDNLSDPNQFGTSLIALGTVRMHGSVKSPTFVRLATEPRAGNTTLSLSQAVSGWQAGDRLILPDTRHLRDSEISNWQVINPQWEELTLQSISADGRTLTLTSALRFDHLGARDGNGTLDFLPHVGNLSRNVIIRSEAPIGTGTQGYTFFTYRSNIDLRYVLFKDLGRTTIDPISVSNRFGREPVHFAHLMGPSTTPADGFQYTFIGNAIDGGSTNHRTWWGIHIEDSHYGLLQDNVIYNYQGWLLGASSGNESFNVIDHNFAVRSTGTGGRQGGGHEGGGFWFHGPNNYIRNNVAANIMSDGPDAAYGFKFFQFYLGNINVPNFKGADMSVSGQYTTRDGNALPVLEFADNEVYGATGSGFSYWWVGYGAQNGPPWSRATADSVFKNLRIWHIFARGIFHYESMRIIHDGLVIRGKDACCGDGVTMNDYNARDVTFRNVNIQGMNSGLTASTVSGDSGSDGDLQTIENSYFRNVSNFTQGTIWTSSADSSWVPPRKVIIRNTRFDAWPGRSLVAISRPWEPTHGSSTNTTQRDELFVYDYQAQVGNNFQVYYKEQATQNIAGGLAPCNNTTTRPEINGITCPLGGTPPPSPTVPVAPSALQVQ